MTKSLTYVEVDCDYCSLTYGVSPCAAQLSNLLPQDDPDAVLFDGTNDWLERGAGLTGAADSKMLTVSVWVKRNVGELDGRMIVGTSTLNGGVTESLTRAVLASGIANFNVVGYNSAASEILNILSADPIPEGRWVHCIASVDMSNTAKRHMYLNDVADNFDVNTWTDDTIDFTLADWGVGATPNGERIFGGEMAELWFAPGVYIDLSIEANRRKFITADRRPVFLGTLGDVPTGSQPLVYLGNPFGSFQTNIGTGGNFTVTGALEAGTFATGTIKCFNSRFTCQDIANFTDAGATLRFAKNAEYLPKEIDAIPSITDVKFTPGIVSLGKDLGQRASLTVEFRDHKHPDTGAGYDKYVTDRTYNPYEQGTHWGRFRTRHPFLQGRSIRVIRGLLGDAIGDMENRSFVIENLEGPSYDGLFTITAKDVLKLADGDRAQAPALSGGTLQSAIDDNDLSLTLSPSGIGNAEYPTSGFLNLGGEIVSFTRSGDVCTIGVRSLFNTTAASHSAGDRVQLCLRYDGEDPADIVYDLLVNYADVPASYITLANWQTETAAFFGSLFTTLIAEPTDVSKLLAEIMDLGFAIWWDDLEQHIHFQVLRNIPTDAATYTDDDRIAHTLKIKEQPETRLSQVWTYFSQKNPTLNLDELDNYRSVAKTEDASAEADYGVPAIRKRATRWIGSGGGAIAQNANNALLSRYRDPPRRFNFDLFRRYDPSQDPILGSGYQLEAWCLQDDTGARETVPIQITRLNPDADRYQIEAEEMRYTPFAYVANPAERIIIIDSDMSLVNLRTLHDSLYDAAESGDEVTLIIQDGVIVGGSVTGIALTIGSWPSGVIINVTGPGRIEGGGGKGGGRTFLFVAGSPGRTALYTRYPINLDMTGGEIWGGGGGGGVTILSTLEIGGGGGGGKQPGQGGNVEHVDGNAGTTEAGGAGANGGDGAAGGNPGSAGANGNTTNGGAAGNAIDGVSYVTVVNSPNILGGQVN